MKKISVTCVLLLGLTICLRVYTQTVNAQTVVQATDQELREFAVAGVLANYGKITSGEGHFRETVYADPVLTGSPGELAKDQIHEFDLSFSNTKFIEKKWLVDGDQRVLDMEAFYDGMTAGFWIPNEKRGFLADSPGTGLAISNMAWRMGLPNTFDRNRVSLAEEIRKDSGTSVARESINGVDCYKLVGTVNSKECKWWIAPSYGFAVVRIEFQGEPDPTVAISAVFVIDNSDFHEYPGNIWLPRQQVCEGVSTLKDGSVVRLKRSMLEVISLQLNQPLDDSTFRPKFPDGVDIR